MKIVNMSQEAMELLGQLCDPSKLEDRISILENAEDQLQEYAFGMQEPSEGFCLYDIAYTIKKYKNDLVTLKSLIENKPKE